MNYKLEINSNIVLNLPIKYKFIVSNIRNVIIYYTVIIKTALT